MMGSVIAAALAVESTRGIDHGVAAGCGVVAVANSLVLKSDGTVWDWGNNDWGQLGNGSKVFSSVPVYVGPNAVRVAGIVAHSLAISIDGTVWSWGYNGDGALGNGSSADSSVPVQVLGLSGIRRIAVGLHFSLAAGADGAVYSWGANAEGQLGIGTLDDSNVPVRVSGVPPAEMLAAGGEHALVMASGGGVWAWGNNTWGQLGDGTRQRSTRPVLVANLSSVVSVAAGDRHSLALSEDGTVWAWGANGYGQLGSSAGVDSPTPIAVPGISAVTAIGAGEDYSLALRADGSVWSWGRNLYQQLGTRRVVSSSPSPLRVHGLTDVIAISAGYRHAMALKSDGSVWAWGWNMSGELGAGKFGGTSRTPVQSMVREIVAPRSAFDRQRDLSASTTGTTGSVFVWDVSGGFLTAGQGTESIYFSVGEAGSTTRIGMIEIPAEGCPSARTERAVQVDFLDVSTKDPFHDYINAIARNGITSGCGGGRYCPAAPITRAQMAMFLLRGEHGPGFTPEPASGTVFSDVPVSGFAAAWIEALAAAGISGGCGSGQFCPDATVTRAQMAVLLLRLRHGSTWSPPAARGTAFWDVPKNAFAADWIEALAAEGITGGCGSGNFCPFASVTRGQLAVFLTRALNLPL